MPAVPKSKMFPVSVLEAAVTAVVLWTTVVLCGPSVVSWRKIWWMMHFKSSVYGCINEVRAIMALYLGKLVRSAST